MADPPEPENEPENEAGPESAPLPLTPAVETQPAPEPAGVPEPAAEPAAVPEPPALPEPVPAFAPGAPELVPAPPAGAPQPPAAQWATLPPAWPTQPPASAAAPPTWPAQPPGVQGEPGSGWQTLAGPPGAWTGPPTMVMPPAYVVPKKGRGCLAKGCLVSLVFLFGVLVVAAGLWLRVPQKLGIWPSADVLWSNEPDRGAGAAMLEELRADGVDPTGLLLYVLPVANSTDVIAYAVLDTSKGFHFPSGSDRPAILDLFVRIGSTSTAASEGIDHIGLEYRDRTGATIGVLTTTPETIAAYARGELTDKQFGAAVAGWVEPAFITSGVEQ